MRKEPGETLQAYLENKVFAGSKGESANPDPADQAGFEKFMQRYQAGLAAERAAVASLKLEE